MTTEGIIAIITALGAAITSIIVAWRTGAKVDAVQVRAEKAATKADEKLDVIHDLANSNLKSSKDEAKAVRDELTVANGRILKLELLIQSMISDAERTVEQSALAKKPKR